MQQFDTPILLLVFNREDKAKRLLESLRAIRPKRIYINADGPRNHKDGEKEKCERVRQVFNGIDWDCDILKQYHPDNLGCKSSVSKGISWFFDHEEMGIILEDDCIPHSSFFPYCETLLHKYQNDERVWHITAHNPLLESDVDSSYFFSNQVLVWGWASWRRAWKKLDLEMNRFPDFIRNNRWDEYLKGNKERAYIQEKWQAAYDGQLDSWAYPWAFSCFEQGGLAIIPKYNLVQNIGFDKEATNTYKERDTSIRSGIQFPMVHPQRKERDHDRDLGIFHASQKSKWGLYLRASFLYRIYRNMFVGSRNQ